MAVKAGKRASATAGVAGFVKGDSLRYRLSDMAAAPKGRVGAKIKLAAAGRERLRQISVMRAKKTCQKGFGSLNAESVSTTSVIASAYVPMRVAVSAIWRSDIARVWANC